MKKTRIFTAVLCVILAAATLVSCGDKTENYGLTKTLKEDEFIIHYAKGDEQAAQDIMPILKAGKEKICEALEFGEDATVLNLYLFSDKDSFANYFPDEAQKGYTGFTKPSGIYMLSPSIYSNSKYAYNEFASHLPVHEMTHFFIKHNLECNENNKLIHEGIANYLASDDARLKEYLRWAHLNPKTYNDLFDYATAAQCGPSFFYFIDSEYGWDKAIELVKTSDFEKIFGKDEETMVAEWAEFMESYQI